jgi:drug/metabolite transporter (DMT)-like permease
MGLKKNLPFERATSISILLFLAILFASNHIAARIAFDNGANVLAAVLFRSIGTILVVAIMVRAAGIEWRVPVITVKHGFVIGLLVALQSFCLYSAVARIPVALALLIFNLFTLAFALLHWLVNGVKPSRQIAYVFPVVLIGLVLALGVTDKILSIKPDNNFWSGVTYSLTAALSFGLVLTLTEKWMAQVDGRLRTLMSMTVVALLSILVMSIQDLSLPKNSVGWLGLLGLTVFYGSAFCSLFMLMPRLDMKNNSPIMNFEPIASLLLAWIVLGQSLNHKQIVGAIIVVGAIVYLGLSTRPINK